MSDPTEIDPYFLPLGLPPFAPRSEYVPEVFDFSYPSQGGFAAIYNRQAGIVSRSTSNVATQRWLQLLPVLEVQTFRIVSFGFYEAFSGTAPRQAYKTITLSGDIIPSPTDVVFSAGSDSLSYAPDPATGKLVLTHSNPSFNPGYGFAVTSATVKTVTPSSGAAAGLDPSCYGVTLTLSDPLVMSDLEGWAALADYDLDYDDSNGAIGINGNSFAAQSKAAVDGTIFMYYIRSRYRMKVEYFFGSGTPSLSFKSSIRWAESTRRQTDAVTPSIAITDFLAKPYFDRWGAFHPSNLEFETSGYQAFPTQPGFSGDLTLADEAGKGFNQGIFGTRIKVRCLQGVSVRLTVVTTVDDFHEEPTTTTETVVKPLTNGLTDFYEKLLPAETPGAVTYVTLSMVEVLGADGLPIDGAVPQILYSQRVAEKVAGYANGVDIGTLRNPMLYATRTVVSGVGSSDAGNLGSLTSVDHFDASTGDRTITVTSSPAPVLVQKNETVDSGVQSDWHTVTPAGPGTSTRVEWATGFRVG